MILATAALAAHLVTWKDSDKIGIAVGGPEERLILLVPNEGCAAGVKVYSGRYGDLEAALNMLSGTKVCRVCPFCTGINEKVTK